MKIYRDGKEIELTAEELRMAYEERLIECYASDAKSRVEDMEFECNFTEIDYKNIAQRLERALGRNDSYWEDFWCTMDAVIEMYIEEGN